MDWYRWWHGTSTDPKFQMVAKDCGISLSCVLGLWSVMLEQASANNSRGSFKFDPEVLEFHLGMDVVTPCNAMKRRGLLHETDETLHVVNWEKRQPKRERDDNSTDRVRHCRERKKENETPCNATQRQVTPRGEEIREEVNTSFDVFWTSYPKKVGKGAAEKAWTKAKINGELESVLAALELQKVSEQWVKESGKFIPNPSTWINEKRWLDELTPVKPKRDRSEMWKDLL